MVTTMQENRSCLKGCVLFVVHIFSNKGKDVEDAKVFETYMIFK